MTHAWLITSLATIAMVGCGEQAATDADGTADACSGATCSCSRQVLTLEAGLPPNVLLVVDASSSMNYPYPRAGYPTRWEATTLALSNLVTNLDGSARFALEYFPINIGCATGPPEIPFGPTSAAAIRSSLATTTARGYTPTYGALYQAYAALQQLTDPNPEIVVLATDGLPNCACINGATLQVCPQTPTCNAPCRLLDSSPDRGDAAAMVTTLRNAGILTYVIGIGFETASEMTLEDFAQRGGTSHYYHTQDSVQLEQALATIGQRIVSCTLAFDSPPHDRDRTNILLDGIPMPRDPTHVDGWDFVGSLGDERGVTLYGSYCDRVQTGSHELTAVFECPVVL